MAKQTKKDMKGIIIGRIKSSTKELHMDSKKRKETQYLLVY